MTNFEKYKDDITAVGGRFGISCGKPMYCRLIECDSCEINNLSPGVIDCIAARWEWLVSEYEEPKINIPINTPIDTKVLVSDTGNKWYKRYYAGFEDGKHNVWANGATSWSINHEDLGCKTSWKFIKLALDEIEEE